jgi:hypothetical protein
MDVMKTLVQLATLCFLSIAGLGPGGQLSGRPSAKDPDCSGAWPTTMTLVYLQDAGITSGAKIDSSRTKTGRIASERLGKDLYHQVYYVSFTEKSGKVIDAIAVHDASHDECSMSGVQVFLVSRILGHYP